MTTFRKNDLVTATGVPREILNTWIKRMEQYGFGLDGSRTDDGTNEARRWGEYSEADVLRLLTLKTLLDAGITFKDAVQLAQRGEYGHGLKGSVGGPVLYYGQSYDPNLVANDAYVFDYKIGVAESVQEAMATLNGGPSLAGTEAAPVVLRSTFIDIGALSDAARRRLNLTWGGDDADA